MFAVLLHDYINLPAIFQEQVGQNCEYLCLLLSKDFATQMITSWLIYLLSIAIYVIEYHKFSSLKHHTIIIAQFLSVRSPGTFNWIVCSKFHRLKSRCQPGCIFIWRLAGEEFASELPQVDDRIHFFVAVGLSPQFLSGCYLQESTLRVLQFLKPRRWRLWGELPQSLSATTGQSNTSVSITLITMLAHLHKPSKTSGPCNQVNWEIMSRFTTLNPCGSQGNPQKRVDP